MYDDIANIINLHIRIVYRYLYIYIYICVCIYIYTHISSCTVTFSCRLVGNECHSVSKRFTLSGFPTLLRVLCNQTSLFAAMKECNGTETGGKNGKTSVNSRRIIITYRICWICLYILCSH